MKENRYCVIMAGGIGSRFWPLSRMKKPKQFLDILGTGKTLLEQTVERIKKIIPVENIFIVTSTDYGKIVREQIPEISENQIMLEPRRCNTAPCIAYANYRIKKVCPDASIVVAPSDHIILKENEFIDVLNKGLEFVSENDSLLTLGIQPGRPETGYGYIQIEGTKDTIELNRSFRKVKTFTEKPDLKMAGLFIESGDFFWNSGIFFWSLKSIMRAFEKYLPEIDNLFNEGWDYYNTDKESEFIKKAYQRCRIISIDYGIMEKADNVYVLCSDFGWSDLGTWGSLYEKLKKNNDNNSISGKNVFVYDTTNCLINIPDDKLVVVQGLNDYILVESDNMILICRKKDEQKIKRFVNDVRLEKGDDFM
jgi:mannose-1-phosphate guanylyltransferase